MPKMSLDPTKETVLSLCSQTVKMFPHNAAPLTKLPSGKEESWQAPGTDPALNHGVTFHWLKGLRHHIPYWTQSIQRTEKSLNASKVPFLNSLNFVIWAPPPQKNPKIILQSLGVSTATQSERQKVTYKILDQHKLPSVNNETQFKTRLHFKPPITVHFHFNWSMRINQEAYMFCPEQKIQHLF